MKSGTIVFLKEEGHFFDPNYSLYETRNIPKGLELMVVSPPDVEGKLTVKILQGELQGEEFRTSIDRLYR